MSDDGVEQGDEADEAKRIGASQLIPGVRRTCPGGRDRRTLVSQGQPKTVRAMVAILWWLLVWNLWRAARELYAAVAEIAPRTRCAYALNCVVLPALLSALSILALVWLRRDSSKGRTLGAILVIYAGLTSIAVTLLGDNVSRLPTLTPLVARVLLITPALLIIVLGVSVLLGSRHGYFGARSDEAVEQGDEADEP